MRENELRQKVADIINGWIGAKRGDAIHAHILSIYNNHKPLARNYPVQVSDAYCATGASAAYIEAGIADYTGTECGVERWVDIAKAKGIWQENDAYRPGVGDAICYDWDDDGVGDNRGYSDHVGIVVAVSGDAITVTECNINGGKVGQRPLMVNAQYIRGYICPDFAAAAKALTPDPDPETPIADDVEPTNERDHILAILGDKWIETAADLPDYAKEPILEMIELGVLSGVEAGESPEQTRIAATLNGYIRPAIVAYRTAKALSGAAAARDEVKRIFASLV